MLRVHNLLRTMFNSTFKRNSEGGEPKKGTDAASCCSVSQGRGQRTGPRVDRLSFNYSWDVYQHLDFEQVAATLNLSFSIGNMTVIIALIS